MKRNSDGEDRIYFKSFLFKYNTKFNDDFVKGYYSHLIADKFWLEGPYEKYIRPKPLAERRPVLEKFYHDYQVLNSFIIEKYNLEQLTLELLPENETITEIEYSRLPKIINETNGDFRDYMDLGETTTLLKKREINIFDFRYGDDPWKQRLANRGEEYEPWTEKTESCIQNR